MIKLSVSCIGLALNSKFDTLLPFIIRSKCSTNANELQKHNSLDEDLNRNGKDIHNE